MERHGESGPYAALSDDHGGDSNTPRDAGRHSGAGMQSVPAFRRQPGGCWRANDHGSGDAAAGRMSDGVDSAVEPEPAMGLPVLSGGRTGPGDVGEFLPNASGVERAIQLVVGFNSVRLSQASQPSTSHARRPIAGDPAGGRRSRPAWL